MDSFFSRYKNILVLVTVLVAQIIGLAVQIRRPNATARDGSSVRLIRSWAVGLITPPERLLHAMGGGIRGVWWNYLDLRHVRQQNRDLLTKMGRLQLEQAALLEDARQGQRLQQLLSFREHYIYSTVPAQIIGTAGTDQSRVLYIDKGSKDGLKPDMAVITPDGIVGKLKDVFAHTSQVLEISDQSSGAGVLLESTRLRGVLRGNALGQPQIINLLPDERIKPGERVITTGGDQIFPRGLPVGVVDHVAEDPQNPPFVDIVIKPAANLGHLEEVLIITQTGNQMPANQKADLAQSAAVGAATGSQRAADILSQRLPGLDPAKSASQAAAASSDSPVYVPPKPPPPLHTDYFSPNATPPASDMTPGKAFTVESVPLASAAARAPSAEKSAPNKSTSGKSTSAKPGKPGAPLSTDKATIPARSSRPAEAGAAGSAGQESGRHTAAPTADSAASKTHQETPRAPRQEPPRSSSQEQPQ